MGSMFLDFSRPFVKRPFGVITPAKSLDVTTFFISSDVHYGPDTENSDYENANNRLVAAMNALPGTPHPMGGIIKRPTAVFCTGDCVHHVTTTTARFEADYKLDGTGRIPWPCYIINGNHDEDQFVNLVIARHGSLDWGVKIGPVWIQALRENYTSAVDTHPPSAAQINAVKAKMDIERPAGEPTIFLVHRAFGNYSPEWDKQASTTITEDLDTTETGVDVASTVGLANGQWILIDGEDMRIDSIAALTLTVTRPAGAAHTSGATVYKSDALDALQTLVASKNTLCILNGHNHYSSHGTWRAAYRVFAPGSVTMGQGAGGNPATPPYATVYEEAFNVLRIFNEGGASAFDVANYNFGFNLNRPLTGGTYGGTGWAPGTWNWFEQVRFTP